MSETYSANAPTGASPTPPKERGGAPDHASADPPLRGLSGSTADRVVPWIVMAAGVALAVFIWFQLERREREELLKDAQLASAHEISVLRHELLIAVENIKPIARFVQAFPTVDRAHFREFTSDLVAPTSPIKFIAWLPYVKDAERDTFEQSLRAEGFPDFTITNWLGGRRYQTAPRSPDYFPIKYIEPVDLVKEMLGSDLGMRRDPTTAFMRAIRGVEITISGPLLMDWITPSASGVLVVVPVKSGPLVEGAGADPDPDISVRGIVIAAIDAGILAANSHEIASDPNVAISIADGHSYQPGNIIHEASAPAPGTASFRMPIDATELDVGGRAWTVRSYYDPPAQGYRPILVRTALAGSALIGSMLLASFISSRIARARVLHVLEERTRDLTQANAMLREQRNRFQSLFDAAIDPLWDWDVVRDRSDYSPSWADLLGYSIPELASGAITWESLVHPDDLPYAMAKLKRCVEEQESTYDAEYRLRTRSGQWKRVLSRGMVVERDASGRATRMVGNVTDITAVVSAREALTASEERFRQLAENTSEVFILQDWATKRPLYISPSFERLWGISREAALSDPDVMLQSVHPDDRARVLEAHREREATGRSDLEYRIVWPTGEVRWIHSRLFPVPNERGEIYRAANVVSDISRRKEAELAMRASEARFRATFEHAAVGIAQLSVDGRLVVVNPRMASILDSTPHELVGVEVLELTHADDRPSCTASLDELLQGHAASFSAEKRFVTFGGNVRWTNVSVVLVRDENDRPLHFIAVVEDISERKAAQEALAQSEATNRALLEAMPDLMFRIDRQGRYLAYHALDTSDLLVPPGDFIGRRVSDVLPPERAVPCLQALDALFRTGRPQTYEIEAPRRAGSAFHEVRMVRCGDDALLLVRNISERRHAELARRVSEELYRLTFEKAAVGIAHVGLDRKFLMVNQTLCDILGYTRDELLQLNFAEITVPEDMPSNQDLFDRALRGEIDWYTLEKRYRRKDRSTVWVSITASVTRGPSGDARHFITVVQDISDRIAADAELRESRRLLVQAQAVGRTGSWVAFMDTGRLTWSDQVFRIFGVDPTAFSGTVDDFFRRVHPDDLEDVRQAAQGSVSSGAHYAIDHRIRRPDGAIRWVHEEAEIERDPSGAVRMIGVVQDITERKLAEEALRRTQLRLATVLERLPDVVLYETGAGHEFVSDNVSTLLGYHAEDLVRDRGFFPRLIHPDDLPELDRRVRQWHQTGEDAPLSVQFRARRSDGSYVWLEDRMVSVRGADGRKHMSGVLIDITERKRAEQRQRLMMAELDHRVKNNLAAVISLVEQTGRSTTSPKAFEAAFLGRIHALARMHKALSRTHWEGLGLLSLVEQTLEPYQSIPPGRVQIRGDDQVLPSKAASPLAMALHELATNAAKYGALSAPTGRVCVGWTVYPSATGAKRLKLIWEESGGPEVVMPTRRGFGSELIQGGIAYELRGEAKIEFNPPGVRCVIDIPLDIAEQAPLTTVSL